MSGRGPGGTSLAMSGIRTHQIIGVHERMVAAMSIAGFLFVTIGSLVAGYDGSRIVIGHASSLRYMG